jgi:hypothetical protein
MRPELLDRTAACEFFGGSRPINAATLYRGASGLNLTFESLKGFPPVSPRASSG